MFKFLICSTFLLVASNTSASQSIDKNAVIQATKDYIQSQHLVNPEQMRKALHPELKKRTFWLNQSGEEFLLETSYQTMLKVAQTYNKNGDRFPNNPRIDIKVLDIDQRAASVKLTVDDWIDYMHLIKLESGEWKIINVLWQYHDTGRHQTKRK
jgi:Putative lumazine-binding